jgi:hypothetical protein
MALVREEEPGFCGILFVLDQMLVLTAFCEFKFCGRLRF